MHSEVMGGHGNQCMLWPADLLLSALRVHPFVSVKENGNGLRSVSALEPDQIQNSVKCPVKSDLLNVGFQLLDLVTCSNRYRLVFLSVA